MDKGFLVLLIYGASYIPAYMPLSLLQPLGILVGIPLLEALRHIFAVSYSSPVVMYSNLSKCDPMLTLSFSMCCFAIIFALGGLSEEKKKATDTQVTHTHR